MTSKQYHQLLKTPDELGNYPTLVLDHHLHLAYITRVGTPVKLALVYDDAAELSGSMERIIKEMDREYFQVPHVHKDVRKC